MRNERKAVGKDSCPEKERQLNRQQRSQEPQRNSERIENKIIQVMKKENNVNLKICALQNWSSKNKKKDTLDKQEYKTWL